jgi:hypothetical protein
MSGEQRNAKITSEHLERKAVVYVRQSTEAQVQKNTESRRLQETDKESYRPSHQQQTRFVPSPETRSAPRVIPAVSSCWTLRDQRRGHQCGRPICIHMSWSMPR